MLDLECRLVDVFGWSLAAIDETDIESLLPFVLYYPEWKKRQGDPRTGGSPGKRKAYADQVRWF